MITQQDILKFAKHIIRKNNGLPDRRLIHPLREWRIGLGTAFAVLVLGCGYASWLFLSTASRIDQEVTIEEQTVHYQEDTVSAALNKYREKAELFNERNRGTGTFSPSLPKEDTAASTGEPPRAE